MPSLQATVTVLGVLLMAGALVSGLARRSLLSLAALFVLAGFAIGRGGAGWVEFDARSPFVQDLAVVALIVILFRDGLEVEREMLQTAWHLPLRKLVLAMPITMTIVAALARALIGLSWTESFLLGALLSPTDPVLTSSIVTNARVPRLLRHSLNLESGLNDGLALPAVLTFLAALSAGSGHFVWWRFIAQDVGLGFVYGIACGWLASVMMPRASTRALAHQIPTHQKSLFALGAAFATYGATVLSPKGNGFIAVFVAAIVLSVRRPDVRANFVAPVEAVVEIVKLGIFVVFGSLLTLHAFTREGWVALALLAGIFVLARPLAVWVALAGTRTDARTRLFMGWFGPKGIASVAFALIVLHGHIPSGTRIFDLTALVVFCSIVVHGLTDTPGANWIAAHAERSAAPRARSGAQSVHDLPRAGG
jgi:NhaP-type Na+/H+ or K+/H+ antiporter